MHLEVTRVFCYRLYAYIVSLRMHQRNLFGKTTVVAGTDFLGGHRRGRIARRPYTQSTAESVWRECNCMAVIPVVIDVR